MNAVGTWESGGVRPDLRRKMRCLTFERTYLVLVKICHVPEGTKLVASFSSITQRTFWILLTLLHSVETIGQIGTLLSRNLKSMLKQKCYKSGGRK